MNAPQKKLVLDHKKLIEAEAYRHSQFIPLHVMQAEAYHLANDAAVSFDPKLGNQFSTHLTNQLKKLSRFTTQHGNVVRLPENVQFKINNLNKAENELKDQLQRPASVAEMADATGMSIQEINHLKQQRKKEIAMSNVVGTPIFVEDNTNDEWMHFVYHDLPERDKLIFEHKTGFGGKPILDNAAIAKQLGLSVSTVANRVKMITEKLAEGWNS